MFKKEQINKSKIPHTGNGRIQLGQIWAHKNVYCTLFKTVNTVDKFKLFISGKQVWYIQLNEI